MRLLKSIFSLAQIVCRGQPDCKFPDKLLLVASFSVLLCPDARGKQHSLKMHRRNSDSSLYCKEWCNERPKGRIIQQKQPVINQAKNLDRGRDGREEEQYREKQEFVMRYLNKENTDDARSETTETSDSGITGTSDVQSEFGIEEASGNLMLLSRYTLQLIFYTRWVKFFFPIILSISATFLKRLISQIG